MEVYHGHQKVIVIDEHTVMLGSLNALSHSDTREVMLTTRGAHFAVKLLAELHAKEFSAPPRCGARHGDQVDLRRSDSAAKGNLYYWRCYSETCPARGKGGSRAWTQPLNLNGPVTIRNSSGCRRAARLPVSAGQGTSARPRHCG